jgi:hypothetical protein
LRWKIVRPTPRGELPVKTRTRRPSRTLSPLSRSSPAASICSTSEIRSGGRESTNGAPSRPGCGPAASRRAGSKPRSRRARGAPLKQARAVAEELIRDAGYDPVFIGGLEQARMLEDSTAPFRAIRQTTGPYFHRYGRPGVL